jgi:hypothetical protein
MILIIDSKEQRIGLERRKAAVVIAAERRRL